MSNLQNIDPLFADFLAQNELWEKIQNLQDDFKNGKIGQDFLIEKIAKIVLTSEVSEKLQNQIIQKKTKKTKENSNNSNQITDCQNPKSQGFNLQNSSSSTNFNSNTNFNSEIRQKLQKITQISQNSNPNKTIIIGNGDILSLREAWDKVEKFGVDGVMIGRGIFQNPWLFGGIDASLKTPRERLNLLIFHLDLWQKTWQNAKNYQSLKKYFKIYIQGFPGAVEMRVRLMETDKIQQAIEITKIYLANF